MQDQPSSLNKDSFCRLVTVTIPGNLLESETPQYLSICPFKHKIVFSALILAVVGQLSGWGEEGCVQAAGKNLSVVSADVKDTCEANAQLLCRHQYQSTTLSVCASHLNTLPPVSNPFIAFWYKNKKLQCHLPIRTDVDRQLITCISI